MDAQQLRALLEAVKSGRTSPDAAFSRLKDLPFTNLGFARVDHHRALRLGVPEVVFAEGKSVEHLIGVVRTHLDGEGAALVTRLEPAQATPLLAAIPELRYAPIARVASHRREPPPQRQCAPVAVVTAGTSDIPVAEEALETLGFLGFPTQALFDVGIAGLHRVLASLPELERSGAVIVVAGMEGALPSVLAGLVAAPIIAVPSSVGYGAALQGFTALFGMLSACSSGISVVNIDNGYGAAVAAARWILAELHTEATS